MDKKELIKALIACDRTKFEEGDQEWLDTLSVEQLEKLKASEEKPPPADAEEEQRKKKELEDKEAEEKKAKEEEEAAANAAITVDDFIAKAPGEIGSVLHRAVDRDRAIKGDLVKALLANERNSFSEEELEGKDIGDLEKLTELGRVEVDYSGRSGGPASNVDENQIPAMTPVFDLEKKSA